MLFYISIFMFIIFCYNINNFGIIYDNILYTPKGKIQYKSKFNICYIERKYNNYIIYSLFNKYNMLLTYCNPNYRLIYKIEDEIKPIPYEKNTPFNVEIGKLILQKKVRKPLGYSYVDIKEDNKWPME